MPGLGLGLSLSISDFVGGGGGVQGEELAFKSLLATGSIGADSDELTLTSNPGFQIGDSIIVEIGGETGLGAPGTKGVGGTWPVLSYANFAAMEADVGQAANQFAWLLDTGRTYRYVDSIWTLAWVGSNFYTRNAIPRSLVTTITGIAGSVLTLADTAVVAATAASVHYDNEPIFRPYGEGGAPAPSGNTLIIPAGSFAVADVLFINALSDRTITGMGAAETEIFSPKGVPSAQIWSAGPHPSLLENIIVQDLHLRGNAKNSGYGLQWGIVTETAFPSGDSYPRGIYFNAAQGCIARRCKVTDVWHMAIGAANGCIDIAVQDCEVYVTEPLRAYIQWMIQFADSSDCSATDCLVDSEYMTAGFEAFRSDGTTFTRMTGRNASFSMNSSGGWLIEDFELTVEALSRYDDDSFSASNPLVNINSNIQPPSGAMIDGGTILNCNIVQEGVVDGDGNVFGGITINADNPNIIIDGGYIEHPECNLVVGSGVNCAGEGLEIDGLQVVGRNLNDDWGNINVPVDATVDNCTADLIIGGIQTNNQINPGSSKYASIVAGISWTVPADWNSADNVIECIGGGGGGADATPGNDATGGGGGAYSKITNLALTPLASITVAIGDWGAHGNPGVNGGDTWFNGASLAASSCGAKGGTGASEVTPGIGGASASGIGAVKYSGGNGGTSANTGQGGTGGGGAGGPNGNGANGGAGGTSGRSGGSGGGGSGGGSNGAVDGADDGGAGGNNFAATGGGAGGVGTAGADGTGGTAGGGGGGGSEGTGEDVDAGDAGPGGYGIEWGIRGAGGGGGGGGGVSSGGGGGRGGDGGLYGGGGGGGGWPVGGASTQGGDADQGVIRITYTP